jgi:transcriptional regulator with XRE-family HTH domain
MTQKVHEGRNIKRFREMLSLKQEALAIDLGEGWSQKRVSVLETKETVEPEIVEQIAKILKIPTRFITDFDEENSSIQINNIENHEGANSVVAENNTHCTFNAIDKILELQERFIANEREMFERLLASEKEKVAFMQAILDKIKE